MWTHHGRCLGVVHQGEQCSPTMKTHSILSPFYTSRRDRTTYAVLLGLYTVLLYPIVRANRYYSGDDLSRSLIGRRGWDANGRPLTTLLMRALQCYDHTMVDISPFTQWMAVALLSWIGVLVARHYRMASPWAAAMAAFPLGGQPFFLSNLSYKFDALSMSLAVLFASFPVLLSSSGKRGWWMGILWIFISLNFYQPAINVYLLFIFLDLVLLQLKGSSRQELAGKFGSWAIQAGIAILIYQLLVGVHINGWVKRHGEKIYSVRELLSIPEHFVDYYYYMAMLFNAQWRAYFAIPLLVIALVPAFIGIRYAFLQKDRPYRVMAGLTCVGLTFPLIALGCALGPLLALKIPLLAARVQCGMGAWLAVGLIILYQAHDQWRQSRRWFFAVAGMLTIGMCVISSVYGNALAEQGKYEERIAGALVDDFARLRASFGVKSLLLDGSAGYAPATAHVVSQFPLVSELIEPYLSATLDNDLAGIFLSYFFTSSVTMLLPTGPAQPNEIIEANVFPAVMMKTCDMKAILHAQAYDMYVVDHFAVAIFHRESSRRCVGDLK